MLITEKRYCIETSDGILLEPYIREFFTSDSQTLFTWPSAILLASYIASSNITNGLSTLELGAGCGLPSIIAALVGKGTRCVLTERPDDLILQNLTFNIVGNGLNDLCQVVALDWKVTKCDISLYPDIDIILGADVFYSSEDFEFVIALIDQFMSRNSKTVFYTTYQERSTRRSICPYLEKYKMNAEFIPLNSFLHSSHLTDGICNIVENIDGNEEKMPVDVSTFDSIYLIKVTRK